MKNDLEKLRILFESNKLTEAEILAKSILLTDSRNSGCHFLLGKVYYKNQQWGNAINHFERALEIDPEITAAKTQLEMAKSILGFYNPDLLNP